MSLQLISEENYLTVITRDQVVILVCSSCERSDKMITDLESGEVICGNCGIVISDEIQDIRRPERWLLTQKKK